ncbi:MAG: transporter substrate-binding domain-containing protein [Desulfobacteraceae bacterium]|nr:transporter substrate-binding domain-containing protein [Desulfobacteraceae bacterium]
MNKRLILIALIITGLLTTVSPALSEEYVLGTFPIPLMVIDENNGVFVELAKEIAKKAGVSLSIQVAPPMRTVNNFQEGKVHGIFPALDVSFPDLSKIERSDSIYIKKDFAFTLKGAQMLKSIADLEGKKVGITRGYPYVRELTENKNIKLDLADSDETNAKKLNGKRIDCFVVEETTGLQAFKNVGLIDYFLFFRGSPISTQDVYFAFGNDDTGKMLAKKLSDAMNALKADGTFGNIMAKAQQ